MHENDKSRYRRTLTLPRSESYLVDSIFDYISADKYPCIYGKLVCNQCPNIEIMSQNFYNPPQSDCVQYFKSRHDSMNYLVKRLYKSVVNNKIELWNAELDQVKDPSNELRSITVQLIRYWMTTVHILKTDLIEFCKGEGIRILFEGDDQQNTVQATGQNTNTSQGHITMQSDATPATTPQLAKTPTAIIQPAEVANYSQDALTANPLSHTQLADKSTADTNKHKPKASTSSIHPMFENFDDLPDSAFVPVDVVAALFGCSIPTVWRRVKQGTLKTHHHGVRSTRWLVGELRQAIKENKPRTK